MRDVSKSIQRFSNGFFLLLEFVMLDAWINVLEVGVMVIPFIILTVWVVIDYLKGKHK